MQKRKVLYVITKSNWGGAQRYVFDLATSAVRQGFDVLVAYGQPGALAHKLEEAHIRTHVIHSMQRDVALGKDVQSFFELYRLFVQERPDVVHLNSSKAAGVGALAARFAGIKKIIFTAHGWPFWEQRGSLSRALIWVLSWLTALFSTKVIVISNYDARVAHKMPFVGHKVVRIHNGVDADMQFGSGEKIRESFPTGVKITGTIGELTKNKNQIALIEEAREKPDMYAAIVGEGELRGFLEAKIKEYGLQDRVQLFGFVPASEALKGFDEFALPSIKEGLPYVLLEARAAGLPIVAHRVGGVSEILDAKDLSDFSLRRMVEQTIALY